LVPRPHGPEISVGAPGPDLAFQRGMSHPTRYSLALLARSRSLVRAASPGKAKVVKGSAQIKGDCGVIACMVFEESVSMVGSGKNDGTGGRLTRNWQHAQRQPHGHQRRQARGPRPQRLRLHAIDRDPGQVPRGRPLPHRPQLLPRLAHERLRRGVRGDLAQGAKVGSNSSKVVLDYPGASYNSYSCKSIGTASGGAKSEVGPSAP